MSTATEIARAINADTACENDWIRARAWTSVPGKERVYIEQANGPALKRWKECGYVDANTGTLVGVPARVAALVEGLVVVTAPAASLPTHMDPAFHAAVRRGEAATHGTDADLVAAVRGGFVTADDAMNQDF